MNAIGILQKKKSPHSARITRGKRILFSRSGTESHSQQMFSGSGAH